MKYLSKGDIKVVFDGDSNNVNLVEAIYFKVEIISLQSINNGVLPITIVSYSLQSKNNNSNFVQDMELDATEAEKRIDVARFSTFLCTVSL